jgi:hypothetical protein
MPISFQKNLVEEWQSELHITTPKSIIISEIDIAPRSSDQKRSDEFWSTILSLFKDTHSPD